MNQAFPIFHKIFSFIFRPGFTRINLPFFYDDHTIDYILEAIVMVAEHGWKLLPLVSNALLVRSF